MLSKAHLLRLGFDRMELREQMRRDMPQLLLEERCLKAILESVYFAILRLRQGRVECHGHHIVLALTDVW